MNILITGDSHTSALKLGLNQMLGQDGLPKGYQVDIMPIGTGGDLRGAFYVDKGDFAEMKNQINPKLVKRLPVSSELGCYDFYGITGLLHTINIWRYKNYWMNFTPFVTSSDLAPISTSLFRHIVLSDQKYTLQMLDILKRTDAKVFVIETPKPYKHHPTLEFVDKKVIAYVDGLYRSIIQEYLAAKEIPIINMPSICYDAEGFMVEAYRNENAKDVHHGNPAFGKLMIQEIIAFVGSQK